MLELRTFFKGSIIGHPGSILPAISGNYCFGDDEPADEDGKPESSKDRQSGDDGSRTSQDQREKTIPEAFQDLDTDEQEAVKSVLDRMTGRKS